MEYTLWVYPRNFIFTVYGRRHRPWLLVHLIFLNKIFTRTVVWYFRFQFQAQPLPALVNVIKLSFDFELQSDWPNFSDARINNWTKYLIINFSRCLGDAMKGYLGFLVCKRYLCETALYFGYSRHIGPHLRYCHKNTKDSDLCFYWTSANLRHCTEGVFET